MDSDQKTPPAEGQPFNFEQTLAELNQLVNSLEKGDLSLEKSLQAFETGIKLTQQCQQALTAAERKVQILLEQDGKQVLEPFNE